MAIPDYQSIMLPLLRFARDGKVHSIHEAYAAMAEYFGLSDEERRKLLPSGKQKVIDNRVGWARTYLVKAGLLHSPKRGYFSITPEGQAFLQTNPTSLTNEDLRQYESFRAFLNQPSRRDRPVPSLAQDKTPEERLEEIVEELRQNLAQELLAKIKECSSDFFEALVVDLLLKMGYGGSRKEAGEVLRRSRDGGIDGIVKQDRLGLDTIYIQAKRWEGPVGRPVVQEFVGALHGVKAKRGVLLTTSYFTQDAKDYASSIETRVVLIDGEELASLMIEHDLGVTTVDTYTVKRIDSDYFVDE